MSVGNLNNIDLNEPLTVINTNTSGKSGTLVDAVIKLYTLDHSYKFISVSQVSMDVDIRVLLYLLLYLCVNFRILQLVRS